MHFAYTFPAQDNVVTTLEKPLTAQDTMTQDTLTVVETGNVMTVTADVHMTLHGIREQAYTGIGDGDAIVLQQHPITTVSAHLSEHLSEVST